MTAKQAKQFTGKRVEFIRIGELDRHRGTALVRTTTVVAVKGRNIQTEDGDWLWAPNIHSMKEAPPEKPLTDSPSAC